jgi:hypothetical protein
MRAIAWIWSLSMCGHKITSTDAGWSSSVARWAHNPEVVGSNPAPATNTKRSSLEGLFALSILPADWLLLNKSKRCVNLNG